MATPLEQKKEVVKVIIEKMNASQGTVLADYRGLTVAEMTELRKQLREAGVEFKVYKNTLMRRAASEAEMGELNPYLLGPTAVAFSPDDAVAPARILVNFAKEHEALEIKAGIIEGRFADVDELKVIASLPTREGLLSMLLSVMQAPIRNFALAVKAVADQKDEQSA